MLVLNACHDGGEQVAVSEPPITARALTGDQLTLTLDGQIDNRQPVGHAVPMAWVPLKQIVAEGETVREGETLATLEPRIARWWMDDATFSITEQQRGQDLALLKVRSQLEDLELKQADLEAQERTLVSAIASTRVADQAQLAIARLDVDNAKRKLAYAQAELDRVQALHDAGHASDLDLAQSRDARDLAEAATRRPLATLDIVEHDTNSVTRRRLELQLERVRGELGFSGAAGATGAAGAAGDESDDAAGGRSGIHSDIAKVRALEDRQERLGSEELARLKRDNARRQAVVDHPLVVARATGLVRYRDERVMPGAKLPVSSFAFVLTEREMIASFQLPEALRGLVKPAAAATPGEGLAEVTVGALGGATLPGRVLSVAAAPSATADGRRSFSCAISFDQADAAREELLARLRPGMRVRCELRIPVRGQAAAVPVWCVGDLRHPRVRIAAGPHAGEIRELDGWSTGGEFIATSGLAPGEAVDQSGPAARRPAMRLSGVVEPQRSEAIRLSSGGWELLEIVPDGALVQKGQVLARLSKSVRWKETGAFVFEAEYGAAKARADYDVARITAEDQLSQSLVAWHDAAVDAERARLERLVATYVTDDEAQADAAAGLASAEVALAQAERATVGLDDPDAQQAFSRNDIAERRLAAESARLRRDRARLELAAAVRGRDWLAEQDARAAVDSAESAAAVARNAFSEGRAGLQAALTAAQVKLRQDIANQRRTRLEIADEAVVAPRAGRVFHRLQWGWQALKIGDTIWSPELFSMPIGGGRRFSVEVPARLYGAFKVGQTMSFVLPALSPRPREGTVTAVAAHFTDSAESRAAPAGTATEAEKVFLLTIGFDLSEADADRVPTGTIAYVDI